MTIDDCWMGRAGRGEGRAVDSSDQSLRELHNVGMLEGGGRGWEDNHFQRVESFSINLFEL